MPQIFVSLLWIIIDKVKLASDVDVVTIADALEGYSGAELKIVAKDVAMVPLRKLIEAGASISEMERSEGM